MPITELLAGAALGLVLQLLHEAIQRAKDRSATTRCILDRLDSTIKKIRPLIVNIENLDEKSNDPMMRNVIEELRHLLERAVILVNAYAELKHRNLLRKYRYKRRIKELEGSLRWMVDVDVQVNQWADIKEIITKMSEMNTKIDEITRRPLDFLTCHEDNNSNQNRVDPSSGANANDIQEPKIDINLRWKRKQNKNCQFRLVLN